MAPVDFELNENDPDFKRKLAEALAGRQAMGVSDNGKGGINPAEVNMPIMNQQLNTALQGSETDKLQEFGLSAPNPISPLRESSYEAKVQDIEMQKESALDRLQFELQKKPEISMSQGIAAALLATIPTLGGYAIGKAVGSPEIPKGTYFPGMSGADFRETFGVGGDAAAAEGAAIGAKAAGGYLDAETKQQQEMLKNSMEFDKKQFERLESKGLSLEQARLAQEAQNQRQNDQQEFMKEERRLTREAAIETAKANKKETIEDLMTKEQKLGRAEQLSGRTPDGKRLPSNLDAQVTKDAAQMKAATDYAYNIADKLEASKMSWAEMQAAKLVTKADRLYIAASLDRLTDSEGRRKSGAVIPPEEFAKIRRFIAGDDTLTPQEIAGYLRSYADDTMNYNRSYVEFAQAADNPEALAELMKPRPTAPPPPPTTDRLKELQDLANRVKEQ
jgi:hypothetical protein